jgi:predicted nucleic acid-binding protein
MHENQCTTENSEQNRRLLRDSPESDRLRVASVGTPIPTNDLWIAASAAQHGLKRLCLDRHFKEVPRILLQYFARMA